MMKKANMNKIHQVVAMLVFWGVSQYAFAIDPLHGSVWKTIDDETGKPKALVEFSERNGKLYGHIKETLEGSKITQCDACEGTLRGQPLKGLPVVFDLTPEGKGVYSNGQILDPKNGKLYRLKGKLSPDGKTLELRGFVGVSLLGRTQIWHKQ